MDKKIIKLDETEEYKFHQHKILILITSIDINKIMIPNIEIEV